MESSFEPVISVREHDPLFCPFCIKRGSKLSDQVKKGIEVLLNEIDLLNETRANTIHTISDLTDHDNPYDSLNSQLSENAKILQNTFEDFNRIKNKIDTLCAIYLLKVDGKADEKIVDAIDIVRAQAIDTSNIIEKALSDMHKMRPS